MTSSDIAELSPTSIVQARSDMLATELSDTETVMLDVDLGTYFGVEGTARTIWDAMAEPVSIADIAQRVKDLYEGDAEQIEADTLNFVTDLVEAEIAIVCG